MEDGTPSHVVANSGMPVLDHFLSKRCGTLSVRGLREGPKLAESEVSGMYGHDVEKAGFGFCGPKFLDSFPLFPGHFHNDRISTVNSRRSKILLRFDTSSASA